MSDWIEAEAEAFRQAQKQDEQRNYLITYSNYWAALTRQIESDIEKINTNSTWKPIIGDTPIMVSRDVDGYKIEKNTFPAVVIYVENAGKEIKLKTKVLEYGSTLDKPKLSKNSTESLKVDSDGDRLFLTGRNGVYLVPEQASQYILSPIMEVLKKS